jgi:hypothetical protein
MMPFCGLFLGQHGPMIRYLEHEWTVKVKTLFKLHFTTRHFKPVYLGEEYKC